MSTQLCPSPGESCTLILEIAWEGDGLGLVLTAQVDGVQTELQRRHHPVDRAGLQLVCNQVYQSLQSASHGGGVPAVRYDEVRREARELIDLLLDADTRSDLFSYQAAYLLLRLDEDLAELPWELIHDGQQLLMERFAIGRQVMTAGPSAKPSQMREPRPRMKVTVLGGGNRDLKGLSAEAQGIRRALEQSPFRSSVNLESDLDAFKDALRHSEVVHFCGHAKFDPITPENSCLILQDGHQVTAAQINRILAGTEKVPRLVFLNTCESGRMSAWDQDFSKALTGFCNAFLYRGVGHVVLTFSDLSDSSAAKMGEAFYRHLGQGETIGESLRLARVECGLKNPAAWNYLLYGWPNVPLQGDSSHPAVVVRQLPSGHNLSGQDLQRVDAYKAEERTQLLTLVMIDFPGIMGEISSGDKEQTIENAERYRRTVRECMSQIKRLMEVTCSSTLFFVATPRPSEAVRFALKVQNRLRKEFPSESAKDRPRIAIHLGEVLLSEPEESGQRGEYAGDQVDLVGRVLDIAVGGQTLLTRAVFDNARAILKSEDLPGLGEVSWLDHGAYLFEGAGLTIGLCEVGETGLAPLAPPADSKKGHHYYAPDQEPVLGWRPAIGHLIPGTGWVLTRKLGEGGFGEIWQGYHTVRNETHVFKFCFRAEKVRSLKREVTLFRLLREQIGDHPNIVQIYDVYFDEPPYYIEMEYIAGGNLSDWCQKQGGVESLPEAVRLEIAAQVADALQAAHDAGVIHRDIKPSNILVDNDLDGPERVHIKLTDFGIGQVVSRELLFGVSDSGFTQTFSPSEVFSQSGSRLYMAPELLAGQPGSTRSDIYSLGVVLYQLLVGNLKRPLVTDWHKDINDPLLVEDLDRCFAGDPLARFPCASELARSLRTLESRRMSRAETERSRLNERRRRSFLIALSSVLLLFFLLTGALSYGLLRERSARMETERAHKLAEGELYVSSIKLAERAIEEFRFKQAYELLMKAPAAHRNWEWGHLLFLCNQDLMTLKGHETEVMSVVFGPKGDWLATGSRDGTIRISDVISGKELHRFQGQHEGVNALVASPDSEILAVGCKGRSVELWTTSRWEVVRTIENFGDEVSSLCFSGDGNRLAVGSLDSTAKVYAVPSGAVIAAVTHNNDPILGVALTREGEYLATTGGKFSPCDCTTRVWEVATGGLVWQTQHNQKMVRSVAFSPDGKWVATGGMEEVVHIWDWHSGNLIKSLDGFERMIRAVRFSPNGKKIVASSMEGIIRVWDTETWREEGLLAGHTGGIYTVAFSPDGHLLASVGADKTCRLWSVDCKTNNPRIFPHSGGDYCVVATNPDGERLVSFGSFDRSVECRDIETGRILLELEGFSSEMRCAVFSPDGRWFVGGGEDWMVRVWDAQSGAWIRTLSGPVSAVRSVQFSRDSCWLACGEMNGLVHIWNTADWSETSCWMGAEDELMDVGWSPDGKTLAVSQTSPKVVLWDPFSKQSLMTFSGHTDCVRSVVFSADGRSLATASNDSTAILWEWENKKRLVDFQGHAVFVLDVAFSQDGSRLFTASEDTTCKVWETKTGRNLITLRGHTRPVQQLSYSPETRILASGSHDGTVRLWGAFPWLESDYPGTSTEPFEDRVEELKREFWRKRSDLVTEGNTSSPGVAPQSQHDATNQFVLFPDNGLEGAIRQQLQKPTGDLTRSDLQELRFLLCNSERVDLDGIENCLNLNYLWISAREVTHITRIAGLKSLKWLKAPGGILNDLTILESLAGLQSLDLTGSSEVNLEFLSRLKGLARLVLDDCRVVNLGSLAGLTNLEQLFLSGNRITDLSPLQRLTNLRQLVAPGNNILDVTPLANLSNLTLLDLSFNRLHNMTPLSGLSNLTDLNLAGCTIESITPLMKLTRLKRLVLANNKFQNNGCIRQMHGMIELDLSSNQISEITPFSQLNDLRSLSLSQCGVTDLSSLVPLKHLRHLQLANNPLSYFTPPEGSSNLRFLGLKNAGISDLSPLLAYDLPKDMELDLFKTPAGRESLEQIKELKARGIRVYVSKN